MLTDDREAPVGSPDAILDTNVAVAIYSWHDILNVADATIGEKTNATLEDDAIQFRARRQRTAFLLALFFNEKAWKVAVPVNEFFRVLDQKAPRADAATSNFLRLQLYFIREQLMPTWILCADTKADVGIKGNAVDRLCMDWAAEHTIPPISWEGWGPDGLDATKLIPKEAPERGIPCDTRTALGAPQIRWSRCRKAVPGRVGCAY
jgi:hypothetical protein